MVSDDCSFNGLPYDSVRGMMFSAFFMTEFSNVEGYVVPDFVLESYKNSRKQNLRKLSVFCVSIGAPSCIMPFILPQLDNSGTNFLLDKIR